MVDSKVLPVAVGLAAGITVIALFAFLQYHFQPTGYEGIPAPDPFAITIDGQSNATYTVNVTRGSSVQLDVYIQKLVPSITYADISTISDNSDKLLFELSKTKIKPNEHVILTISAPNDVAIGLYSCQVEALTKLYVPTQVESTNAGDSVHFFVRVT